MNIVHVVRQFYPAVGGFESVALELASAQVTAGHKVRVITLNRLFNTNAVLPARDVVCGAEVIRLPYFGSQRYPLAPSVIHFIRDADIIHVHAIDFFFDYLAWTRPLHRKKLVVSTHGGFFHTTYAARLKRLYFQVITRASSAWYDGVVAVSAADYNLFKRIRKGVVCIENGVNVAKYYNCSPTVPSKCLLALGRLSSNKRLERVVSFVAALRQRDPQWKLVIAGRQWDVSADEITQLAKKVGVLDAVEVVVGPNDDEIRRLVRRCSVIASASSYEGFGLAAVEGMSAGLFPVLNDIPPFRDLISRTGVGLLVDFSNSEEAAEAFADRWREVAADFGQYRLAAMEAASAYDWPQVCRSYEQIYEGICGMTKLTIEADSAYDRPQVRSSYERIYEGIRGTTKRTILGVPIFVGTASQAIEHVDSRCEQNTSTIVAFANAHTLNVASRDESFRAILRNCIVFNDGIGVDIASVMLFGAAFPQNLNGTDFTPHYLQNTRLRHRIFLLGGRPGTAERAGAYFGRRFTQHQIVGYHTGYFAESDSAKIVALIKASEADVVLVAMGNPLQEKWLADNLELTGAKVGFAVGALFDFVTGNAPRAPAWIRYLRVEWLHRLLHEPVRLARRYLLGNPRFILRIVSQRISGLPTRALLDQ